MQFNSMTFIWIFLPIVLLLYYMVKEKYRNLLLVIASLVMYAWGEPIYVVLLITSIFTNYVIGLTLDRTQTLWKRKLIVLISIIINIGILCFFKYYNFFAGNINKLLNREILEKLNLGLPLGISFFTFSAISYILDLYRKKVKVQKNIVNMALYISFFPKLLMGPIEKYYDFEKFYTKKDITIANFANGVKRFVYGLSKKVIIANTLGCVVDNIFGANITSISMPVAWLGAICYMLQIYFDFSGYSDMAIGLGKMFGFNLSENFKLPYISQSITEFWRRWHISLSTWFKEYLYIPLGGNRKGKVRTYINLFIVFLTTGIWHGASWNFIIWGVFNGIFMVIERVKLLEYIEKNKFKLINHIYMLFVTLISWVLFRANGIKAGVRYLERMFIPDKEITNVFLHISDILTTKIIFVIIVAILFSGILQIMLTKVKNIDVIKNKFNIFIEPFVIAILFLLCIMSLISGTYSSFIYFKF